MSDAHTPTAGEQAERDRAAERRVAELVRAVDVRAPATLHRRVREMVASPTPRRRGWSGALDGRLKPTLAAMAVAAALGAAIALLTGGVARQQGPGVSAASQLTLSAATTGAPHESSAHAAQLNVAVDGVAFPYWKERFGWRATGTRTDTLDGRRVTTVFYSGPDARRIGYAIVGGTPAPGVGGGTVVWHRGVAYRLRQVGGVPVVTWQRGGRLCVLSGRGVSGTTLVRLASWGEGGSAV
jgi:hypothetical protein